jgi:hypothetical protein
MAAYRATRRCWRLDIEVPNCEAAGWALAISSAPGGFAARRLPNPDRP